MAISIKSGSSGSLANVDTAGNLAANLPIVIEQGGFATMSSEKDPGEITGERYCISPEASEDYRLRVGLDSYLDNEVFNYSAQNTAKHRLYTTTMTAGWSGGYMTTNNSGITTANTGLCFSSYRTFPVIGTAPLYCEVNAAFTSSCPTLTTLDFGLFTISTTNPYLPADGVYFRYTSAGLLGVLNYGGSETQTGVFDWTVEENINYHFAIVSSQRCVEFWIDDVLYAEIEVQAGFGQPFMAGSAPFSIRHAIGATAASGDFRFKIADKTITLADLNISKEWSHQLAGNCGMSYQGQSGHASVLQTCDYPINTLPTAGNLSTTAARSSGLGGQFAYNVPNKAATDYLLTAFQNPVNTLGLTGRLLYITSITLSDYTKTDIGSPSGSNLNIFQYNIIFGAGPGTIPAITVVADTAIAKAWRTIPLGFTSFAAGAQAGNVGNPGQLNADFNSAPIVVMPGEWIGTSVRVIEGPSTGVGSIGGIISFKGYWE